MGVRLLMCGWQKLAFCRFCGMNGNAVVEVGLGGVHGEKPCIVSMRQIREADCTERWLTEHGGRDILIRDLGFLPASKQTVGHGTTGSDRRGESEPLALLHRLRCNRCR